MEEKRLNTKLRELEQFLSSHAYLIIFFIGLAIVCYMFLLFPHYSKLKRLRQQNRALRLSIHELQQEISQYEQLLKKQDPQPYLYEKIARDELGVAKKNEIVVDINQ